MRWLILVALVGVVVGGRGDGDWNDDDLPVTISSRTVSGDIFSDQSAPLRFTDPTTGAGLFTTNTDPNVVGVDPLTGEDAPVGTDVGFGAAVRRGIHTNVMNGDFAIGPPDPSQPISDTNPLPYWKWEPEAGGRHSLQWVADPAYASGYKVRVTTSDSLTVATSYLTQFVPVPMSQGKQYRVLLSSYSDDFDTGFEYQFYRADATTAIGSAVETFNSTFTTDTKRDAGLVPATAAYVRIRIFWKDNIDASFGEVRAAFLPAEATVSLKSNVFDVGPFDTTQTQLVGATIPANTFTVGSVYEFDVWGNVTSTAANTVTFRIRVGPTTLTGTIVESLAPTATTTASDNSFHLTGMVTVRSVGASGTIIGGIQFIGQDTQPFSVRLRASQATAAVTVDTTVANVLEVTAVAAAGTTDITVQQATIKCVMAS